jgi:hypothetical protein
MRLLAFNFVTPDLRVESKVRRLGVTPIRRGFSIAPLGPKFSKPARQQNTLMKLRNVIHLFIYLLILL